MDKDNNKSEKIVFSVGKNQDKYIKGFVINGIGIKINTFFNAASWEKLIDSGKKQDDYKKAFAKAAFFMYSNTKTDTPDDTRLSEQDFFAASDEELQAIMDAILSDDNRLTLKYGELTEGDTYSRFYLANNKILEDVFAPLKKTFDKYRKNAERFNYPALQKIIERNTFVIDYSHVSQLSNLHSASLNRIAEMQAANLNALSLHINKIDFSGFNSALVGFNTHLQSIISAIPKFDFAEKLRPIFEKMMPNRDVLTSAVQSISNALSTIDFSMLSYNQEWSERHDFLVTHGWFYLNELPKEIIDSIYEQKDEITTEQVDKKICEYFRENNCSALKKIVKTWRNSPYFELREHIFHQALVNHSRKYYNTSITLTALHTEGVITDFMRIKLQDPKYRASNAVEKIIEVVEDIPLEELSLSDYQIYIGILYRISEAFCENFSHANPDSTSDFSRHKIAHGHVVAKETEVNSLRRFLYINEIYRLFVRLDMLLVDSD